MKKSATWEKSNDSCHTKMRKKLKPPTSRLLSVDINYSHRWLIAIDIGTTLLYIRYKRPGSNDEYSIDGYPGHNTYEDAAITLTDLYYPPDGSRPIWGRTIQRLRNKYFDPRRLVRFWKPAIHQNQGDSSYHDALKAQAMHIFGVPDVSLFAKDFFALMFDFLFHHEEGYFYKTEMSFRIELASVILSKPSGWPQSEYLIFQDAAEAWGLKGQISFVSETDGLAKSWLRREAGVWEGLKVGLSMIIVDWGGGTVDIDALEIKSFDRDKPEKIQVQPSGVLALSLKHGCETSLELFASHMRSRFSDEGYPTEKIGKMVDDAVCQFSEMKSGFSFNQDGPPCFLDFPEEPGGAIRLEEGEIKQQFEPSIKATIDAIDGIIEKLKKSQGRFPEGGGSKIPLFFDSLVERYERGKSSKQISVMRIHDYKRGVAMGAVHLRQDITGFMKCSMSRESYAIPCRIEDVPGADREQMLKLYPGSKSTKIYKDGRLYFPIPVLQWFIKEGDEVGPNIEIQLDDECGVHGSRQAKITSHEDLHFEEHLVIYRGHPGAEQWTSYDTQSMLKENYRIEKLIVDLRDHIEPNTLPSMNSRKSSSNRRVRILKYDYSVKFEGETPIYFLKFEKPGENTPTKLRIHNSKIDLAQLETHQNLTRDIPSSPNNSDAESSHDESSGSTQEIDETVPSSDSSSIREAPKLAIEQEMGVSKPATTTLSNKTQNISVKRTLGRLVEVSEDGTKSSAFLQHNDSAFSAMAQDTVQKVSSQSTSNLDPRPHLLRSCTHSVTAHKRLPRPLQNGTRRVHEIISDSTKVTVGDRLKDSYIPVPGKRRKRM